MNDEHVKDGDMFCGSIVDQYATTNRSGELQIIFGVSLQRQQDHVQAGDNDTSGVTRFERDVFVTLSKDKQRFQFAMDQLRRLGFESNDFARLHPDHPQFVSFIGREVKVRSRVRDVTVYWNFAWPRWRPEPASLDEVQAAIAGLKSNAATLPQEVVQTTNTKPQVGY